ncbi:MAG: M1 family metallopeptidase [Thermoanaerobaculales bacterium]|nr:M1 family metallopeptidase [Thermoanaerobaculales bacterium]
MARAVPFLLILMATFSGAADLPVDYEIEVDLDPIEHRLRGSETIRWTNNTAEPTAALWFHLYLNAFANDHTTFMRGMGSRTLRGGFNIRQRWGWTRILALRTAAGSDLLPGMSFERPDDGNEEDFSVARVLLPEPVEPGSSVTVHLEFEAQLPRVIARTGWAGDFHLVGQWFPKLGVFEPAGRGGRTQAAWNCHQFHASSEFFADFGRYRVQITVPDDFIVGATGVLIEERELAEGNIRSRVFTFTADRVHDFVWCAAPEELMAVVEAEFEPGRDVPSQWLKRAQDLLGLSAAELELPPVHIRLLVPQTQTALTDRMLRGARLAIAWYGLFYGAFPYPQLTVVSPPPGAEEAAGMEYPTFITTGSSKLLEYPPFSWFAVNESVTVHEFGHQYFQGMIASNEFEQAWMDEGLNSYAEVSCMVAVAEDGLVPKIKISDPWRSKKWEWAGRKIPLLIDQAAWEFRTRRDYGTASYTKAALALKTLEGLVGPDVFARAMRHYADRWRWRHPTGKDFWTAVSESSGEDLGWFFEQAFRSDATVDWGVGGVHQSRRLPLRGAEWQGDGWLEPRNEDEDEPAEDGEDAEDTVWEISVDVVRHGEFVGPVDLMLIFADGREERRHWDDRDRWVRFEFESPTRLGAVVVDPDGVWALESERENNYWRDAPDPAEARRRLWWAFAALRLMGLGVQPWS